MSLTPLETFKQKLEIYALIIGILSAFCGLNTWIMKGEIRPIETRLENVEKTMDKILSVKLASEATKTLPKFA